VAFFFVSVLCVYFLHCGEAPMLSTAKIDNSATTVFFLRKDWRVIWHTCIVNSMNFLLLCMH